jgi:hypothetical protein
MKSQSFLPSKNEMNVSQKVKLLRMISTHEFKKLKDIEIDRRLTENEK